MSLSTSQWESGWSPQRFSGEAGLARAPEGDVDSAGGSEEALGSAEREGEARGERIFEGGGAREEGLVDEEGDLRRIVVQESPGAIAQRAGQMEVLSALGKGGSLKAGTGGSVEREGGWWW